MYDRTVENRRLTFGVSGRLYESNVLIYDHQTESLWSQLKEEAVTGPLTGTRLTALPSVTTTWKAWRRHHPDTLVLSTDTGFSRNYNRSPYLAYEQSTETMFPTAHRDSRLPRKAKVIGLSVDGEHRVYPLAILRARNEPIQDQIGTRTVRVVFDAASDSARILDAESGQPLPATVVYWFASAAFHPNASIYGREARDAE